jgi:enolase
VTPTISSLWAREVLDSGGRPTVEVELELSDGTFARSSVPAGTSTGRHEAREVRDGDPGRYDGQGVLGAVRHVRETIAPLLLGRSPFERAEIDAALVELDGTRDKSRLGANAVLGVSTAVARAAAAARGIPLWQHLGGAGVLPLPMVNVISGGLHGDTGLEFQDFLVVPVGAETFREALECVSAVRSATARLLRERGLSTLKAAEGGFAPPLATPGEALELLTEAVVRSGRSPSEDVAFAVDVAATHFFDGAGYRLRGAPDGIDAAGMIKRLERLVDDYPVVSIEDGLAEDDWEGWVALTERLGSRVQVLGDDLFATNEGRLRRGIDAGVANSVLVKMNQIGTLTETLEVIALAQEAGYAPVVSARSGETCDDFIADLAVATGAGQIKIGSLAQSERLAKYNQLLRIEEQLGAAAAFAGSSAIRVSS